MLKDNSTSEPQDGRYIVLYFSLLAIVVKLTGMGIDTAWNLFRFLIIFFLALSAWKLSGEFFSETKKRFTYLIVFLFGGGLGWTTVVLAPIFPLLSRLHSTDLIYYLGYTVFSFMFHPLAMLSLGFILWETIFLTRWLSNENPRHLVFAVGCFLLAFFNHPASGVVGSILAGITFLYALWVRRKSDWVSFVWRNGIILGGGAVLIGLYLWWARGDPVYVYHQAYYLSWERREPFWMYPFAMGLPFVLGLFALARVRFSREPVKVVSIIFFGSALLLSLMLPAGVKYLYLVYPAVVGFSIMGLHTLVEWIAERFPHFHVKSWVWGAIVILVCASVPFVVENRATDIREGEQYFLTRGEDAAIHWLASQGEGIVLSSPPVGQVISWRTHHLPYLAHGFLTMDYDKKQAELRTILDKSVSLNQKQLLLSNARISYVFYGPREKKIGELFLNLPLEEEYSNDDVVIYRVLTE
ncbi:MAG: hypothetical protein FJY86_00215 [Candidatus Diapherotrites archaeon]|uniref:Uncharacterized protein n=1 Tax=Candidatus Iainarchaeum sp. TaxID=3101447 RepID=A0A8T4C9B9_9ARCH|nr:hypothetical protein [Candidatus Diapherotrites archaeon]